MSKMCSILLLLISGFIIMGCDNLDKQWHKYKAEKTEIWGMRRADVEVLSHGWKLIDKSKPDICEWGWEITIKVKNTEKDSKKLLGITGIEYTLQDKDHFNLTTGRLNLDNYRRVIWDSGTKGAVLQEYGETVTYRGTGKIPVKQAKRAKFGSCRILLQ